MSGNSLYMIKEFSRGDCTEYDSQGICRGSFSKFITCPCRITNTKIIGYFDTITDVIDYKKQQNSHKNWKLYKLKCNYVEVDRNDCYEFYE